MNMPLSEMRAIILAAGLGTRMRPLTDHQPKPMIQVGPKRLIDHVLDWMGGAGIGEVVVNTHYHAAMLEAHLAQRIQPRVIISHEPLLLETGGGICKALPLLGDRAFFAANSDAICLNAAQHALLRLYEAWDDAQMDALLLLHPVTSAVGYEGAGDFDILDNGSLKRKSADASAPYVFTGVQMLHPRLFEGAPTGAFSLNRLYNRGMTAHAVLPRVKGLVHDGRWLHVGDPAAIAAAEAYL